MTEKEAIKELSYDETAYGGYCSREVREIAIRALEKQISKKPIYVDTRFRHHGRNISDGSSLDKCYKCPNCSLHIFHVFDSEMYCKYCGQAIDFGKEEE